MSLAVMTVPRSMQKAPTPPQKDVGGVSHHECRCRWDRQSGPVHEPVSSIGSSERVSPVTVRTACAAMSAMHRFDVSGHLLSAPSKAPIAG